MIDAHRSDSFEPVDDLGVGLDHWHAGAVLVAGVELDEPLRDRQILDDDGKEIRRVDP